MIRRRTDSEIVRSFEKWHRSWGTRRHRMAKLIYKVLSSGGEVQEFFAGHWKSWKANDETFLIPRYSPAEYSAGYIMRHLVSRHFGFGTDIRIELNGVVREYHLGKIQNGGCSCGQKHKPNFRYFVSVIDGPRSAILLGPYRTHQEALNNVERGRRLGQERDSRAVFYGFGTCGMAAADAAKAKPIFGA